MTFPIERITNKKWSITDGCLSGVPNLGDTIYFPSSGIELIVKGYSQPQSALEAAEYGPHVNLLVTNKNLQGNPQLMSFKYGEHVEV